MQWLELGQLGQEASKLSTVLHILPPPPLGCPSFMHTVHRLVFASTVWLEPLNSTWNTFALRKVSSHRLRHQECFINTSSFKLFFLMNCAAAGIRTQPSTLKYQVVTQMRMWLPFFSDCTQSNRALQEKPKNEISREFSGCFFPTWPAAAASKVQV